MKVKDYVWPVIGLAAVAVSAWLLYHELRSISIADVLNSLAELSPHHWVFAALSAVVAYAALAGYDTIALRHLGRRLPWQFVALCSFTTYALSHNIGASVISGAVVRYRAYTSQGLSAAEVGVLVAMCSLTFSLSVLLLGGIVLLVEPSIVAHYFDLIPPAVDILVGLAMLSAVALYVVGSWAHFRPIKLGHVSLTYPRLPIVARQLLIGPIEVIGAAGIIYFALPEAGNPGFVIVLGIFIASFCAALLSHAPGGLGVLEIMFLTAMPDADRAGVFAALIVFRLFYLLIPFALSLLVILLFEKSQLARRVATRRG